MRIRKSSLLMLIACFSREPTEEEIGCHASGLNTVLEVFPADCDNANGTITLTTSGGNGNYRYKLDEEITTNCTIVSCHELIGLRWKRRLMCQCRSC